MVTFDPSHRDEEYGEKDLLPPHDNHDWKREATLENGIQSLGKQAEHIKPGQRKRRQQILPRQRHGPPHDVQTQSTQPFSSLEVDLTPPTISPIRCYRQCTSSTPASPSDDHAGFSFPVQAVSVPGPRCLKPDTYPLLVLPRSSSSGEQQPLDPKVFTPKRMADVMSSCTSTSCGVCFRNVEA